MAGALYRGIDRRQGRAHRVDDGPVPTGL